MIDDINGDVDAEGALGIAREGAYVDTLIVGRYDAEGRALSLIGAFERPGVYEVTIAKAGYDLWKQEGIRVRQGTCHVRTAELEARLSRR